MLPKLSIYLIIMNIENEICFFSLLLHCKLSTVQAARKLRMPGLVCGEYGSGQCVAPLYCHFSTGKLFIHFSVKNTRIMLKAKFCLSRTLSFQHTKNNFVFRITSLWEKVFFEMFCFFYHRVIISTNFCMCNFVILFK